ncbi:hypothetical protein CDL15_Pgr010210 [Punica granatum]|uniref:Uncharacterized protein n=1 Tax=Punica granatum TaxID=22663 RepID=A0A218XQU5_PUNGR|nr:hypothetical protein CDL15_Pgr010210 [Punica granatum]
MHKRLKIDDGSSSLVDHTAPHEGKGNQGKGSQEDDEDDSSSSSNDDDDDAVLPYLDHEADEA